MKRACFLILFNLILFLSLTSYSDTPTATSTPSCGIIIYDSFNRTDNHTSLGTADTGQTWVEYYSGDPGHGCYDPFDYLGIYSNQAKDNVDGGTLVLGMASIESLVANGTLFFTLKTLDFPGGTLSGLLFRLSNGCHYFIFYGYVDNVGNSKIALDEVHGSFSSRTNLFTLSGYIVHSNDVLKVVYDAVGNISMYDNGSLLGSIVNTDYLTNTKVGMMLQDGNSADDFTLEYSTDCTSTNTYTVTVSPTETPTETNTTTGTITTTKTSTATNTATNTATRTATKTFTNTATETQTKTLTPTLTSTMTFTATTTITLSPTSTPTCYAVKVADLFQRKNSQSLGFADTGQFWNLAYINSYSLSLGILNQQVYCPSINQEGSNYIESYDSDGILQATLLNIDAGSDIGLLFRYAAPTTYWILNAYGGLQGGYIVQEYLNGVLKYQDTSTLLPNKDDVLKVNMADITITAYVNNLPIFNCIDLYNYGLYENTKQGLSIYSSSGKAKVGNFKFTVWCTPTP